MNSVMSTSRSLAGTSRTVSFNNFLFFHRITENTDSQQAFKVLLRVFSFPLILQVNAGCQLTEDIVKYLKADAFGWTVPAEFHLFVCTKPSLMRAAKASLQDVRLRGSSLGVH